MEIMRFEHPVYFGLLVAIPLLMLIFGISRYLSARAMKQFGNPGTLGKLMPWRSFRRPWIRLGLAMLALGMMILAAVNPLIGSRLEEAKREGLDIVVAIDVSQSMLAEDVNPNRLERARMSVSRLIDRLEYDRVGIVAFAGNAVTQVPLTADHHASRMLLRTVNTESVSMQGTAIGSAIERAMTAFRDDEPGNKVIVILSDGENHMDDPLIAARLAAQKGIVIHTIGVGSREGAPIPIYRNNQLSGYLRDNQGNTVISRYDEQTLAAIAAATGGSFREGRGSDMGLSTLLAELRQMDKAAYDTLVFTDYESRFHYFAALAALLIIIELLLYERKNKWLEKIKPFTPAG